MGGNRHVPQSRSDVLTIDRDNGEHFVMRWHLDGDTLVLERDRLARRGADPVRHQAVDAAVMTA